MSTRAIRYNVNPNALQRTQSAPSPDWEAKYWSLKFEFEARVKKLEAQLAHERQRHARDLAEAVAEARGEKLIWPEQVAAERHAAAIDDAMSRRAEDWAQRLLNAPRDYRRAVLAEARRNVRAVQSKRTSPW